MRSFRFLLSRRWALFAVFLLLTQQVALTPRLRWMAAWGAVLGLIALVRPVNGLVLLAVETSVKFPAVAKLSVV